ncbi:MAG: hypothetical protein AAFY56_04045 [Pseudomonadota bacterium]
MLERVFGSEETARLLREFELGNRCVFQRTMIDSVLGLSHLLGEIEVPGDGVLFGRESTKTHMESGVHVAWTTGRGSLGIQPSDALES